VCGEVRKDGQHSPVAVLGLGDVEFEQQVSYVCLHGATAEVQALGDAGVGEPFGHQLEHLTLTLGQLVEAWHRRPAHHATDDVRVERRAALGHAFCSGQEVRDLKQPVLQEV
jgi:hypothetical protein